MKAVVIEEFGPPEVLALQEVGDPLVGRGDALIEVEFCNVTFVETQIRSARALRLWKVQPWSIQPRHCRWTVPCIHDGLPVWTTAGRTTHVRRSWRDRLFACGAVEFCIHRPRYPAA